MAPAQSRGSVHTFCNSPTHLRQGLARRYSLAVSSHAARRPRAPPPLQQAPLTRRVCFHLVPASLQRGPRAAPGAPAASTEKRRASAPQGARAHVAPRYACPAWCKLCRRRHRRCDTCHQQGTAGHSRNPSQRARTPAFDDTGDLPCPRVRAVPMGSAGSRASSEAEAEEGGIARVFCGEPEIACCSAHRREMGEHDGCEDGTESDSIDLPQFAWPWEALSGLDPADYSLTLAELDVRCHEAEKEVRTAKVCSGLHQRASFLSSLSDALSVALSSAYRAGLDTTLPAMGTRMDICAHKHAPNKHTNMHVRTHTRAHGHAPPHVLTWMYAIYFTLLSQCI